MPTRKRRARGEGTIRWRRDGRWEGRLTLPDGRRKSVFGRTQREALAKLRQLQQEVAQGQLPAAGRPPTLAAFLETWLTGVQHRCGPRTVRSYQDVVRLHLVPTLGREPLDLRHLTPARIQALVHAKQAAGLSPRTVTYIRDVLSRALNEAVRWGWLPRNPAPLVAVPRQVRRPVPVLTPDQARGLLAAARAPDQPPYLAAFLSLLVGLGLRRGEALGLSWADVDFAAGTVRITAQVGCVPGAGLCRRPPKSPAALRTLPLPPVVADQLAAWQRRQAAHAAAAGPAWQAVPWQPVFTTAVGTPPSMSAPCTAPSNGCWRRRGPPWGCHPPSACTTCVTPARRCSWPRARPSSSSRSSSATPAPTSRSVPTATCCRSSPATPPSGCTPS